VSPPTHRDADRRIIAAGAWRISKPLDVSALLKALDERLT
jgi:hypothetical protein